MKIESLMTRDIRTVRPDDSLNEAARRMWEGDCGSLPVVDGEGHLVGMITDRDICMGAYTRGARLGELSVSGSMASHVVTCQPSSTVTAAVELMTRHKVRRLPVVTDTGELKGVVGLTDLARAACHYTGRGVGTAGARLVEAIATINAHPAPREEPAREVTPAAPRGERLDATSPRTERPARSVQA